MTHVFQCVVHEPKPVRLDSNSFKKPPNKVTEENKDFWSKDIEVGGSICKKCYEKYRDREKPLKALGDILPNDSMVCI